MVIAFSLYAILAYKRFHRRVLLSDSRGNLYIRTYNILLLVFLPELYFFFVNSVFLAVNYYTVGGGTPLFLFSNYHILMG